MLRHGLRFFVVMWLCSLAFPAMAGKKKKGVSCSATRDCQSKLVCLYSPKHGRRLCAVQRKIGQTCSVNKFELCPAGHLCGFKGLPSRCVSLRKAKQRCGTFEVCGTGLLCKNRKCASVEALKKAAKKKAQQKAKAAKKKVQQKAKAAKKKAQQVAKAAKTKAQKAAKALKRKPKKRKPKKRKPKKRKSGVFGKIKKGAKKVGGKIKKGAKKAGKAVKKAAKKAGKAVKKGAKKAGKAVKKAAKKVAQAALVLKRKIVAFAKKWARKAKNKVSSLVTSAGKKQAKKASSMLLSKIRGMMKSKLRAAAGKIKMGKSTLARSFGGAKRGSQFSRLAKNSLKRLKKGGSSIATVLASLATDAAFMFAYSAASCGVSQQVLKSDKGSFGNCFANKAAEGTFEYFYGLLIGGIVMEAATYTVLAPAVTGCVSAVSAALPGPGLLISGACVPAIQSVAQEVLDSALKQSIKSALWTGGPNYQKDFYRLYGGK
ncbi:MAG: hypothetical protein H6727_17830 [Myxococcales bacterium]|nr:hypothetical protein [Myxococcales bacterium]